MGKTRDLFKKIRDTKRTLHTKMGSIKDRNGLDLTEAEDIKKRWQEYTEELYKKDLHDPYNHNGVITHLESDILECEVKWALESITMNKASGGEEIPVELFQILKDDAVIIHLEPDILECEVKWALESITMNKASGGDGIPVVLFLILKDDDLKVLQSVCQQIWKTQQWLQDWKRSVFIPIPKKGNAKECSNYAQLHSSHMLVK